MLTVRSVLPESTTKISAAKLVRLSRQAGRFRSSLNVRTIADTSDGLATARAGAVSVRTLTTGPPYCHDGMKPFANGRRHRRGAAHEVSQLPQLVAVIRENFLCPADSPWKGPVFRPVAEFENHRRMGRRQNPLRPLKYVRLISLDIDLHHGHVAH